MPQGKLTTAVGGGSGADDEAQTSLVVASLLKLAAVGGGSRADDEDQTSLVVASLLKLEIEGVFRTVVSFL